MTNLTKNDILLRYEELNGFDYKLRITESVVAAYIQVTTSASEQFAMKQALEMRDPMLGWAMVMDQDERFYEWCKRVFKKDAIAAYNDRKKTFVVFFVDEGKLKAAEFKRVKAAFDYYDHLAKEKLPCAVYVRNMGRLHENPIRQKNKPEEIRRKVHAMIHNGLDNQSAAGKCRLNRGVASCQECLRYETCRTRREN